MTDITPAYVVERLAEAYTTLAAMPNDAPRLGVKVCDYGAITGGNDTYADWLTLLRGGVASCGSWVGIGKGRNGVCGHPEPFNGILARNKPSAPDARAIARMDEALLWPSLIPDDRRRLRRIVAARAMTQPSTGKPAMSWRAIGSRLGCSHEAVRAWHGQGVALIVLALRVRPKIC